MTKTRPNRDPNAPKRNKSAYLIFQNEQREHLKSANPGLSFGDLSKMTSAMYQTLSAEQKAELQRKAELDKQRYLNDMMAYIPPPGYDQQGNIIPDFHLPQKTRSKSRDPGAPKRNLSAYLLYQNAMRDQFRAANPDMSFGQLSKYTSQMYKSLTPGEKAQWEERARRDKERFDAEMSSYEPPLGYNEVGDLMAEFSVPRKNSRRNPKDPNMPKRARGSYVLFTFDERPRILEEHPGIGFTLLGNILGQRWRALSAEDRQKYDDLAQQDKARFAAEMEVYKLHLKEVEAMNAENSAGVDHGELHHEISDQGMNNYVDYKHVDVQNSNDHVVDFVLQNHHHDGLIPQMVGHNDHHSHHNEYIQHSMNYHHPDYVTVSLENDEVAQHQLQHLQHQMYEQHDIYQAQLYHSRHPNYYQS